MFSGLSAFLSTQHFAVHIALHPCMETGHPTKGEKN